jgi:uncharacterized membrane protein
MAHAPEASQDKPVSVLRRAWLSIRARLLGGLLLILPVLITFWVIHWLYSSLEKYVIDPFALLVLRQVRQPDTELPYWFETYAAPCIAILIVLLLLYALGFLARSRLRQTLDWVLLRVPVISVVYKSVQSVFQTLDKQREQKRAQRVVMIAFPHPGMKALGFVTATCRDRETGKVILCVYVPTTPVPTSGYFLLVPEEEVMDLSWTAEEGLQTIISGGLTAPAEISYYQKRPAAEPQSLAKGASRRQDD